MDERQYKLNRFLVDVFDEILKTQEDCLALHFPNLSLRELHLIEAVCRAEDEGLDDRSTAIAAAQRVTAGTLTTAVNMLEKKGYLDRQRDQRDRRVVHIFPTELARKANEFHQQFHQEMVEEVARVLTPDETEALALALGGLTTFFQSKYKTKGS